MKIETTLEQMRADVAAKPDPDFDASDHHAWAHVWGFAEGFAIDDVAEVLGSVNGYGDSLDSRPWSGKSWDEGWLAVLRLKDGRHAYLAAACDYTGWG